MSTTNVKRIAKTRSAVDYELYGSKYSEKYKKHKAEGTNRVAAMRCDLGSPEEFVELAEQLRDTHGRKVEARSIIQSFESSEMDPNDPNAVQYVNDLGYEFAKRLHPNSHVLVITHTDAAGGNPHNHIKVMNHDNVTGKALQGNHMHWMFQEINNDLMRENNLRVAEKGSRQRTKDAAQVWEERRFGPGIKDYDRDLGDKIEEALMDDRSVDIETYRQVLDEKGITFEDKPHKIKASEDGTKPASVSIGRTYFSYDEVSEKPRMRRRAASSLSDDFTYQGTDKIFELKQQQQAELRKVGEANVATGIDIGKDATETPTTNRGSSVERPDSSTTGVEPERDGVAPARDDRDVAGDEVDAGFDVADGGNAAELEAINAELREPSPSVGQDAEGTQRDDAGAGVDQQQDQREPDTRDAGRRKVQPKRSVSFGDESKDKSRGRDDGLSL